MLVLVYRQNVTVTNVSVCNDQPGLPTMTVATIDHVLVPPPAFLDWSLFKGNVTDPRRITQFFNLLNSTMVNGENDETVIQAKHEDLDGDETERIVPAANGTQPKGQKIQGYEGGYSPILRALNNTHGMTLFVPQNWAFKSETRKFNALAGNATAYKYLANNHIINGTSVYSPEWGRDMKEGEGWLTNAGTPVTFTQNSTGKYVQVAKDMSGDPVIARIVQADVPVANGVIHIVDRMLFKYEGSLAQGEKAYDKVKQETEEEYTKTVSESGPLETGSVGSDGSNTNVHFNALPDDAVKKAGVTIVAGLIATLGVAAMLL